MAWRETRKNADALRVVLGGMVCYMGLAFLAEWLYDAWFRLSRLDYALIVIILALIAVFGILPGVIAGLLIAVVLFVVIYSRIDVVKHTLTGAIIKSRMTRSYTEQEVLRTCGSCRRAGQCVSHHARRSAAFRSREPGCGVNVSSDHRPAAVGARHTLD